MILINSVLSTVPITCEGLSMNFMYHELLMRDEHVHRGERVCFVEGVRIVLTRVLEYSVGSVDLEEFGFISRVLVGMQL